LVGYAAFNGLSKVAHSPYWMVHPVGIVSGLWFGWTEAFLFGRNHGRPLYLASQAVGVYALGVTLASVVRMKKRKASSEARLFNLFFQWGLLVTFFLAFWSAGSSHFRLHVVVPWIVAWTIAFARSEKFFRAQFLLTGLLFILNFSTVLYPEAFLANNVGYKLLGEIRSHLRPGDLYICSRQGVPNIHGLRPYFFPELNGGTMEGRLFEFHERSLDKLLSSLRQKLAQGRLVYFGGDLLDPEVQVAIEQEFHLLPGEAAQFFQKFKLSEAFRLPNGTRVFQARL
jgi:hypothetical protein